MSIGTKSFSFKLTLTSKKNILNLLFFAEYWYGYRLDKAFICGSYIA